MRCILVLLILPVLSILIAGCASSPVGPATEQVREISIGPPAPGFPIPLPWYNVPYPLTMGGLEGKVVLLVFWSSEDPASVAEVRAAEGFARTAGPGLAVIAVHASGTGAERTGIRDVLFDSGIRGPVVDDADGRLGRTFAVHEVPSLVVIDQRGRVVGGTRGPGGRIQLFGEVGSLLETARLSGSFDPTPLPSSGSVRELTASVLRSPRSVAVDPENDILYIADTGHHRIIAVRLPTGETIAVIGGIVPGWADGGEREARFRKPAGLALSGGVLYVADQGNHAVRAVDPSGWAVSTVCRAVIPWPREVQAGPGGLLAVSAADGTVFQVYPDSGTARPPLPGWPTAPAGLGDGAGTVWRGRRIIADTAGDRIIVLSIETGEMEYLFLNGEALVRSAREAEGARSFLTQEVLPTPVGPGIGIVKLAVRFPDGFDIESEGGLEIAWHIEGEAVRRRSEKLRMRTGSGVVEDFVAEFLPGTATITLEITASFGKTDEPGRQFLVSSVEEVAVLVERGREIRLVSAEIGVRPSIRVVDEGTAVYIP